MGALVGLLALGLAVSSLATRHVSLIPLIWIEAILPGVACAWVLFAPTLPQAAAAEAASAAEPA